jgi:hypothetical protein
MNTRQYLQFESIINCQAVLNDRQFRHAEIDTLRGRLDKATADLRKTWHAQGEADGDRSYDSGMLRRTRKEVRQRLLRISRRAIVVLDGLPGIRDDLRVPHATVKDADLLKAAARIVKNLRPHLRTLHETGLPKDSMPSLLKAMKALKEQSAKSDTAIARRSVATASLPSAIRRARDIAKALDSVIKADLDGTAVVMWNAAYRIPRKKGRPKKARRASPRPNPS